MAKRISSFCAGLIGLTTLAVVLAASIALAAPPDIVEEDLPAPSAPRPQPKRESRPAQAPAASSPREKPDRSADREEAAPAVTNPVPSARPQAERPTAERAVERSVERPDKPVKTGNPELMSSSDSGDLIYTVRSGDTPSAIADLFNIDTPELLSLNHLSEEAVLHKGATLKIPNPYAAQVRALKQETQRLNEQLDRVRGSTSNAAADAKVLRTQLDDLASENEELKHGARTMPWWRAFALTEALAGLFLLVIFAAALLDWFFLRRRFRTLVEMNESLRRLDHKYKAVLAKAELRFQQLYGRRRQGMLDGQDVAKTSEEIEIERLNQELKETLEQQLDRLGSGRQNGHRRSVLRDFFANLTAPAAERPPERR